jgi:hypothetical protein
MRRRVTPFGLAVFACLILAGWALWSGGILDGPIARQVRSSSVYAAPGAGLDPAGAGPDQAAAERIIGNRRLVVVLLEPGSDDLRKACDAVRQAAKGTLVLVLSRDGDEYDNYGCALLPDVDGENFGRAAVAETTIAAGVDGFADQPLQALKVVAVNYDGLVRAGVVPDGARTISPSLPRYLIAAAALAAVVLGAVVLYVAGRRAGRLAADAGERREADTDARTELGAAAAVLAQQIIDLDARYATGRERSAFDRKYRRLSSDYTELLGELGDGADPGVLGSRIAALSGRCRELASLAP